MRKNKSTLNPECPAIAELADTLEACFPSITLLTTNNVSPGTRHTAGLAIDIMLDVTKKDQRQLAHGIIDVFINHHSLMMWSDLIYSDFDGKSISYFHIPARGGYGGQMLKRNPYTSDTRHGDHIHLDWVDFSLKNEGQEYLRIPYKWSDAAKKTGFSDVLSASFRTLALKPASGGVDSVSQVVKQGIAGKWKVTIGGWKGLFVFDQIGSVYWAENEYGSRHNGNWTTTATDIQWRFKDPGDFRTFKIAVPQTFSLIKGTILPAGQGFFEMQKM